MNVQAVLTESLRAPSAHNAQPWRITPQPTAATNSTTTTWTTCLTTPTTGTPTWPWALSSKR